MFLASSPYVVFGGAPAKSCCQFDTETEAREFISEHCLNDEFGRLATRFYAFFKGKWNRVEIPQMPQILQT